MPVYRGRIKMTRPILMFGKSDKKQKSIEISFSRFRYTSSNDGRFVYAFLLIWPNDSTEIILGAPLSSSTTVVTLLGSSADPLPWHVASGTRGIVIDVSNIKLNSLQSDWTWAFKLGNLLPEDIINSTAGPTAGPTPESTAGPTPGRGVPVSFDSALLLSVLLYIFSVRV